MPSCSCIQSKPLWIIIITRFARTPRGQVAEIGFLENETNGGYAFFHHEFLIAGMADLRRAERRRISCTIHFRQRWTSPAILRVITDSFEHRETKGSTLLRLDSAGTEIPCIWPINYRHGSNAQRNNAREDNKKACAVASLTYLSTLRITVLTSRYSCLTAE